jgi:hypothetical protein
MDEWTCGVASGIGWWRPSCGRVLGVAPVVVAVVVGPLIVLLLSALKVVPEYERAVFPSRSPEGRQGAGTDNRVAVIDRLVRVRRRTVT